MSRIKRYAIPILAASIALLGAACAQPAGAATRSPGALGADADACAGITGGTRYMGIGKWTGRLAGCLYHNGKTFAVTNTYEQAESDIFIVSSPADADYTYAVPPLGSPSDTLPGEQAADMAEADVVNYSARSAGNHATFAPGQTVTIEAPTGQTVDPYGLHFSHERIATTVTVIARAIAEAAVEEGLTPEAEKVNELAECAEYIRHRLDGSDQAPPISSWDTQAYVDWAWGTYKGDTGCKAAWGVIKGDKPEKPEGAVTKFLHNLLDEAIPDADNYIKYLDD